MERMNVVWIGLALAALGAVLGLFQQKWTLPAVLGVVIGFGLAGYGYYAAHSQPAVIEEEVLGSDENLPQQPVAADAEGAGEKAAAAAAGEAADKDGQPAGEEPAAEVAPAPDIPEHVITGQAQPWVEELAKLVAKPNHFPLAQSGWAPEDAPNSGDRIYEYVDIKLAGRAFQTVFLSKKPDDPNTWMVHVEPGASGLPIQPEELGKARILGEGGNFMVFLLEDGPFAGDYLIWATGGHRGGGEAIRIYTPSFLSREHGLAAQIAAAAGEAPQAAPADGQR